MTEREPSATAAMPSAVASSVRTTVRTIPTRSATRPQTNLPAAPPAKRTASAPPTPATVTPFSRRKGRKVSTAVRVAVSTIPTAASAWKPRASRIPQPPTGIDRPSA